MAPAGRPLSSESLDDQKENSVVCKRDTHRKEQEQLALVRIERDSHTLMMSLPDNMDLLQLEFPFEVPAISGKTASDDITKDNRDEGH